MKTYEVNVVREGKWWMVHVPEIDGLTQARRLSEAPLMARELIAVTTGVALGKVEVDIDVSCTDSVTERAKEIRAKRDLAAQLEHEAVDEMTALARQLVHDGIPVRDVGTLLGVSFQRVHQLVNS